MAAIKLNYRAKGSTILEVIISMIVIVVVFGIAMMIYTNVLRLSLSAKKIKAEEILEQTLSRAEQNIGNTTQSFSLEGFRIEQQIIPYQGENNLSWIHLTAYDQNQQMVAELQKVISNEP